MSKPIAEALLRAQKSAEAVGKTSRNDFAKFNYASAETMIAECREHLHNAGLVLFGNGQDVVERRGEPTLYACYTLMHESGDSIEIVRYLPIVEGKGKPLDKAALGAATETLGYLLRDLLLIPRQEVDVSGRDDTKHAPKTRPRKVTPDAQGGNGPAHVGEAVKAAMPDAAETATQWITEAWGDATALDEVGGKIKEMGLEGEDRERVLSHFLEAKGAAK